MFFIDETTLLPAVACSMQIEKPSSNETLLKEMLLPKDIEEGAADIGLKVTRIPCIRDSELWTTIGMDI